MEHPGKLRAVPTSAMDQLSYMQWLCHDCKTSNQAAGFVCNCCGKTVPKISERKRRGFLPQRRNAIVFSPQQAKELRQKLAIMMSSIVASGASTEEIPLSSPKRGADFKTTNHKIDWKRSLNTQDQKRNVASDPPGIADPDEKD
mmetsp:Transcript_32154/g.62840  ORF Transcript_32154/g.62840 Transcript_32154/m.62840 type:complete len:144 (+) Transcript_32154:16-447(+)